MNDKLKTGFIVGGYRIKIARCEDCGGDALYIHWPPGWMQSGGSEYGAQYEEEGLAWHCPECRCQSKLAGASAN